MAATDNGGTRMHVYSYDDIYQVTQVDYPTGYDYLATDTTFTYDDAGNRLSVIDANGASSYATNALNQYTSVGGVTYDYDANGNLTSDDKFQYAYDPENRLTGATRLAGLPDPLTAACDTTLVFTTGGTAAWFSQANTYHDDADAAQSGAIGEGGESWMETTVEGEGTLTFWWNHSSASGDYLDYRIDGVYQETHTGGWQQKTCDIVGFGTHTIRWRYYKNSDGVVSASDCGWVDNVQWTPATNPPSSSLASALDTTLSILSAGHADWESTTYPVYYDGDSARSGYITHNKISEMQTTISGSGTLSFYWRVSSEANCDWLEFYLDGVRQDRISGTGSSWAQKTYDVTGAGNHTLLWRYTKDGSTSTGDDQGYVDYLQWSGAGPIEEEEEEPEWQTVSYTYDPAGRRIEKKVDGTTEVKYVYDGDHILAEYNNAGTLLRKYVHGPGVDEPICMIEASGTYAGTHYYHYDALGSVVAMTNSSGNVVEFYEYSVYGQVAASDASHPNRFMFTGREFDKDTGLYYYRARYYNPEIGRFLQTDPIGYGDGMNLYRYCGNNVLGCRDPYGLNAQANNGDMDGDGIADPCDPDMDGDGVPNDSDEEPNVPGPVYVIASNNNTWIQMRNGIQAVAESEAPATTQAAAAVRWANTQIGDPTVSESYSQGGTVDGFGPDQYKCNKFVADAFQKGAGVKFARQTADSPWIAQANILANTKSQSWVDRHYPIVTGPLKVGDIISFHSDGPHGHTSIYVGNGEIAEANPGVGLRYSKITDRPNWQNLVARRYRP